MRKPIYLLIVLSIAAATGFAQMQAPPQPEAPSPFYRVLVIGRTVQAVNYGNRTEPTKIDFRGTVLQQKAKGSAEIIAGRGVTEIDAKWEGLTPPTRFGPEYLTYVLWAISPDGRAVNLGEVIPDGSNHAHVHLTTQLQAFGLVITAEPYYSVTTPSDVVVMENVVRPDTQGTIEAVNVKYELAHRGQYTFDQSAEVAEVGPKVSMGRYQSLLALYEAQNAIQIAAAEGAEQYAADTLARARALLEEAHAYDASRADNNKIIMIAREAAEAAEDARVIAARHLADGQVRGEVSQGLPPEAQGLR